MNVETKRSFTFYQSCRRKVNPRKATTANNGIQFRRFVSIPTGSEQLKAKENIL